MSDDDLICAAYTIGGIHGTLPLEQRAAAAAAAGFRRIGCTVAQYRAEREAGRSDADIRALLDRRGVAIAEIEFLYGWAADGSGDGFPGIGKVDWRESERLLLQLADAVGARFLNCGEVGFDGPLLPLDEAAERFAGICDRAAEHGLTAVLEAMPWTELPDPPAAWEVVRRAGRENGGVLLDAWHFFQGPADFDALRAIPAEAIKLIQLGDGVAPAGPLYAETVAARRPPGEGDFDLVGLLRTLDEMGVPAPISVEVLSHELEQMEPEACARRVHDAACAVLSELTA